MRSPCRTAVRSGDRSTWLSWMPSTLRGGTTPCFVILADIETGRRPLRELHVLEFARLVVDAYLGRRDPAGKLAGLDERLHQPGDEIAVSGRWQPFILLFLPGRLVEQFAGRARMDVAEFADLAMRSEERRV